MNIYNNGRVTLTVGDIERMQQRIAELEQKNSELAAQVEVLRDAATKITLRADNDGVSTGGIMEDVLNLRDAINATSSQCLKRTQAEAGQAGFIAGYSKCWTDTTGALKVPSGIISNIANRYAERVKAGEV